MTAAAQGISRATPRRLEVASYIKTYIFQVLKLLIWVGSALDDLRAFPPTARRRAGVWELRVHAAGAYRLFYIAKFEEGIYVLHAFEKRSRRTSRLDLEIGARRYRAVIEARGRA